MKNSTIPDYFIKPRNEINEISLGLKKYNTVLLIGDPGIGKTVLAKYYEINNPLRFKEVIFYSGIEFEFDESKFAVFSYQPNKISERLIIIDGFDEILSNEIKNRITKLVLEERKYGTKILITTRPLVNEQILNSNSYQIKLQGWSKEQVMDFLNDKFRNKLDIEFIDKFQDLAASFNYNPLLLYNALELLQNEKVSPNELLKLLNQRLLYKNKIIEPFEKKNIILTEQPKIISDIRLINSNIINKINRNPSTIYKMSSRQFEELVAELFEKEGYKVNLTQATRDGGKDLLIIEERRIGNFIIYAECKNYSMNNPVGVRLVRELYGTVVADKATAGVLITSSYFSKPAIEFKEQVKSQLSLLDYYDLKKWIEEIANNQGCV